MKDRRPFRVLEAVLVAYCLLVLSAPVHAKDKRLPVKVRMAVLFKTLTYDQNLEGRSNGGVRIGIVSQPSDGASQKVAAETLKEIQVSSGKQIKGLAITAVSMPLTSMEEFEKAIEQSKVNTLYLCPGVDSMLAPVLRVARSRKILLITGEADLVKEGAAIGAVMRANKPKILVHVEAAAAQGAKLDARLLRLVEVIR